jgi:hypothetical protein
MKIMKKIDNNKWMGCLGLLVMLAFFTACEKSLMTYKGPESIYFSMQKNANPEESVYLPDASINLMNQVGSEVEFGFNVMVTGEPKDYDRPYRVGVVADSTTAVAGTDFILPEGGVIKAGHVSDSLYVKLLKNDELQKKSVRLYVQVLPNEHFSTNFTQFAHDGREYNVFDPRVYDLTFTSMMTKPYWWESYSTSNPVENGNLGYFTAKKITLLNELYSLTYADWLKTDEGGTGAINLTRVKVIYKKFALYLIEQYKNHTPVQEEDGRLMWVIGCPWESVVGQAWDGTYIDIED